MCNAFVFVWCALMWSTQLGWETRKRWQGMCVHLFYICVNILNVFVVNSPWVGDQEVLAGDGHWPRSYTSNPPSYALTVHTNTHTNTDTNTHTNTVSNLCTIVTANPIMTSLLENTNSLLHCTVFTHFSWSPFMVPIQW